MSDAEQSDDKPVRDRGVAAQIDLTRRQVLAALGIGAFAGTSYVGARAGDLEGAGADDLHLGGISTSLTELRQKNQYYSGPQSAFSASKLDAGQLAVVPDDWGYAVKGEDGSMEVPGIGTASKKAGASYFQSLTTDEEVNTPRESGNAFAQRGGHMTNAAPTISYYASTAQSDARALFQDNGEMYIHTPIGGSGRIYRSTDWGASWTQKGDVGNEVDVLIKGASGTLIAITGSAVHRSTDNGGTWSQVDTLNSNTRVLERGVTETPNGNFLYGEYSNTDGQTVRIRRSTDDGQTWSTVHSTNPSGSPAQYHCLVYDRKRATDTLVAFRDNYNHGVLYSTDEQTWTYNASTVGGGEIKFLNPMFFENYIAWAFDRTPNSGWIARISRSDFYNGNYDTSNYEFICQVAAENYRAGYQAMQIDTDTWVVGFSGTDRGGNQEGEAYSPELWAVYDDGKRASHLDSFPGSQSALQSANRAAPRLPMIPFDREGQFDTLIQWGGHQGTFVIPCSITYGRQQQTHPMLMVDSVIPDGMQIAGFDESGNIVDMLHNNQGTPELRNRHSGGINSTVQAAKNLVILKVAGNNKLRVKNSQVQFDTEANINGQSLTGIKEYSDDTNPSNNELYYDTTDSRMEYKDSGGTIHNLG